MEKTIEEVRDIGVLLWLLKSNYHQISDGHRGRIFGLCFYINRMFYAKICNDKERLFLKLYLNENQPKSIDCIIMINYNGYWYDKRDVKSRMDWLNTHIKLNTK